MQNPEAEEESECGPAPTDIGLEGATAAESFRRARGFAIWGVIATVLLVAAVTQVKSKVGWADYATFSLTIGALMGYGDAVYLTLVGWWQRRRLPAGPPTPGAA